MTKLKRIFAIGLTLLMIFNALFVEAFAEGELTDASAGAGFGAGLAANRPGSYTIGIGESVTLFGQNGRNDWKAGKDGILRFGSHGTNNLTVTGLKVGRVTVTHRLGEGAQDTESWEITVNAEIAPTLTGPGTVVEFRSVKLSVEGIPEGIGAKITWSSENPGLADVDNNGNVTGVAATEYEKPVRINALVEVTGLDGNTSTVLLEKDMTVVRAVSNKTAKFYYLKTPTSNPASNAGSDWGRHFGNGTINIDNGSWNGINMFIADISNRVISWPAGFEGGRLPRGGQDWNAVVAAYQSVLKKMDITEKDIDSIVMHPYKISNNSGDYHVDVTVEIRAKAVATATFYLWDAGSNAYIWKSAENVRAGNTVSLPNGLKNLAATKTVGGRKYRLVSWYDNAALSGTPVTFPYTVEKNVNFYAKYIPGYMVTYDPAGGTVLPSIPVETKEAGNTVLVKSAFPVREGYFFKGWKIGTDDSVKNGGDSFVMPEGDVTLTATWEAKTVIRITADSAEKAYDGAELTAPGYTFNEEALREGDELTAVVTGALTLVGEAGNKVTAWRITRDGADVTDDYVIETEDGILTVTDIDVIPGSKTHSDGEVKAGDVVTFTLSATNIYGEPEDITFVEQSGVTVAQTEFPNAQPGETVTTTATYTVMTQDAMARRYTNTVEIRIGDKSFRVTDTVAVAEPEYDLTIRYLFVGGGEAVQSFEGTGYKAGDTFSVPTPLVEGYVTDRVTTDGTFGNNDVEVTVFYRPAPEPEKQPEPEAKTEPEVHSEPEAQAESKPATEPDTLPEVPAITAPEAESAAEQETAQEPAEVKAPEITALQATTAVEPENPVEPIQAQAPEAPAPAAVNNATRNAGNIILDVYPVPLAFDSMGMNTGDCVD